MREYQDMEAYKINFNAKEQVSAATCNAWDKGSKFTNGKDSFCDVVSSKYGTSSMPALGCAISADGSVVAALAAMVTIKYQA